MGVWGDFGGVVNGSTAFTPSGKRAFTPLMLGRAEYIAVNGVFPDGVNAVLPPHFKIAFPTPHSKHRFASQ